MLFKHFHSATDEICSGDHIWSQECWRCCCRGAVLGLGILRAIPLVDVAYQRSATMSNATLFCGTFGANPNALVHL